MGTLRADFKDIIWLEVLDHKSADPHQAAEAAAFTLTHTPNQPRSTSAQNHLF